MSPTQIVPHQMHRHLTGTSKGWGPSFESLQEPTLKRKRKEKQQFPVTIMIEEYIINNTICQYWLKD